MDQGRVYWPAGIPPLGTVRVVFNQAQSEKPSALRLEDYDTREPFDVSVEFELQGTGKWARFTAATVTFKQPEHRGRSFRWFLVK